MRLLVDAHCLIWAVDDPAKLAAAALEDAENEPIGAVAPAVFR